MVLGEDSNSLMHGIIDISYQPVDGIIPLENDRRIFSRAPLKPPNYPLHYDDIYVKNYFVIFL